MPLLNSALSARPPSRFGSDVEPIGSVTFVDVTGLGLPSPRDAVELIRWKPAEKGVAIAGSKKDKAAGTFKKTFGMHALACWIDNTGELASVMLHAGNAGSNTAADLIVVLGGGDRAGPAPLPAQAAGHLRRTGWPDSLVFRAAMERPQDPQGGTRTGPNRMECVTKQSV
jgi:hypothetical protein